MPVSGKRQMERFPLELPASISVAGKKHIYPIKALTSDVSAGGAFFQTDAPLPIGTRMNVDLVLPLDELKKMEGKRASIKLKGYVIRASNGGMAISFDRRYQIAPLSP